MIYGPLAVKVLVVAAGMTVLVTHAAGDQRRVQAEQQLRKRLLQDYDKSVVPGSPTTVYLSMMKITHFELLEEKNMMELHTWFAIKWHDERLGWQDDVEGLTYLAFDSHVMWKPDLTLYNGGDPRQSVMEANVPLIVFKNGTVLFVPPLVFHFPCTVDLTFWPHDTQNCSFKVGSWVHHEQIIDLIVEESKVEVLSNNLLADGSSVMAKQWQITNGKASRVAKIYPCCPDNYISVLTYLELARNAPAYTWTVKVPVVCLSLVTLVVFLLPPGAGEKLTVGFLCIILDVLFVAYTSHVVAHAPSHTPLIVKLVSQQLVLVVVSVVVAGVVARVARAPHPSPLPNVIKAPVTALSNIFCLANYVNNVDGCGKGSPGRVATKGEEVELGEEGSSGEARGVDGRQAHQWLLLAALLDRLALILYLLVCIISLIRFTSVL